VNILIKYIKYRIQAKNRHGIHSPFVYSFSNECTQLKVDNDFQRIRKTLFSQLKKNKKEISITDFGAGSKRLSSQRTISKIFTTCSSKGKYGLLLYKIARHYQPKTILEFGTSIGIGSIHFSFGAPLSTITTVEACHNTYEVARSHFKSLGISNINAINDTFQNFLKHYNGQKFDLVFIDGHHDGVALKNYLELLNPHTHNDTLFILDDIRWSNSMFEAWKELCASQDYHVTMDLFRMGIILKRSQQVKEHFVVSI